MFIQKAEQYARRGLVMAKRHAQQAYQHGRSILSKVDYGFQTAKKVHKALTGLVDNKMHQRAQKALSDFDSVRGKVMDAHSSAERVVHAVKRAVPDLGL